MCFAMTGTPVFRGDVEKRIPFAHVDSEPGRPSKQTAQPVHAGSEEVVMRCPAKDPASRPATIDAVDELLAGLVFDAP